MESHFCLVIDLRSFIPLLGTIVDCSSVLENNLIVYNKHMKSIRVLLSLYTLLGFSLCVFAQKPSASYTIPNSSLCSGKPFTLTSTSEIGVGSIAREKWIFITGNPTDTVSSLGGQTTVSYKLDAGSYIVNLIAFGPNGQADTADGIIRIKQSPVAKFTRNLPCSPQMATLTNSSVTRDGTILFQQWQLAGFTSTSNVVTYSGPTGTFAVKLIVESSNGCRDTLNDSITYTDAPMLSFSPNGPLTLCQGEDVSIIASGADSLIWDNGTIGQENIVNTSGFNVVRGINTPQCIAEDSIQVNVVPLPKADAGSNITLLGGKGTTLLGSGGIDYTWTPSEGLSDPNIANPVAKPAKTTSYILTVKDDNDCSSSDTVIVTVDLSTHIPVHNMLTPNGDGFNDTWALSSVPDIENAKIYVFNRWGWEVFKAEDGYKNDWDGTVQGEPLADGSYLYVIEYNDDSQEPLRGALQIIRNLQK